ncbi:acyltransferase [uncultured Tolumonas sp.]|uniref:acyltransferase n=1 Tax=uncultured Tolumonas sp. TaxID=263765 RepID=UPI002A0A8B80|nr:acyltransferase [uncultured Tolumonas sp.]
MNKEHNKKHHIYFNEIDGIKALSILGVVLVHSGFESRLSHEAIQLINVLRFFFGWCVVGFFFTSGYLNEKNNVTTAVLSDFIKKKIYRLIIPCFVFSITYKLILVFISSFSDFSWSMALPKNIGDFIFFLVKPVGPQFYFMAYLFFVSVIYSCIRAFFSVNYVLWILLLAIPFIYRCYFIPEYIYGQSFTLIPIYTVSYVIGAYFRDLKNTNVILFFCFYFIFLGFIYASNVFMTISIPFFLFFIFTKWKNLSVFVNKSKLGKYSSAIYVWHAPIVLPFMSIISVRLIGNGRTAILLTLILTIILCILIKKIVIRSPYLSLWHF